MTINLRLTHYWPFTASAAEAKMEGAPVDRKGHALHTVEDFLSGNAEFVSLAGDYEAWPYGQRLQIPWGDKLLLGRVVDTGGHFHGAGKVYRVPGYEPIDVCVFDRRNSPPRTLVTATIVAGDHFDRISAMVAVAKFQGQAIAAG